MHHGIQCSIKVSRSRLCNEKSKHGHTITYKIFIFKNNVTHEKISRLKLNKLTNVKVKYEQLEDVDVLQQAHFKDTKMSVSQIIMKAKLNGLLLFNGIEEGGGKNEN